MQTDTTHIRAGTGCTGAMFHEIGVIEPSENLKGGSSEGSDTKMGLPE